MGILYEITSDLSNMELRKNLRCDVDILLFDIK